MGRVVVTLGGGHHLQCSSSSSSSSVKCVMTENRASDHMSNPISVMRCLHSLAWNTKSFDIPFIWTATQPREPQPQLQIHFFFFSFLSFFLISNNITIWVRLTTFSFLFSVSNNILLYQTLLDLLSWGVGGWGLGFGIWGQCKLRTEILSQRVSPPIPPFYVLFVSTLLEFSHIQIWKKASLQIWKFMFSSKKPSNMGMPSLITFGNLCFPSSNLITHPSLSLSPQPLSIYAFLPPFLLCFIYLYVFV